MIGPWRDYNAVLREVIHENDGSSRRLSRVGVDMARVDALLPKIGEDLLAESIAPHPTNHGHFGSEPGSHHGLIGALAAEPGRTGRAGHSLARSWQPRDPVGQVHVAGANHSDPRRRRHWSPRDFASMRQAFASFSPTIPPDRGA